MKKDLVAEKGELIFEEWSKIGSDLLITGSFSFKKSKNEVIFVGTVYELPEGKVIFQKKYWTQPQSVRRLAHQFVARPCLSVYR